MATRSPNEESGSRERILDVLLRSEEPQSVPELAKKLGISRNATNLHVGALERGGVIERASVIPTRGRPSQGYRLSPAGKATFPRQYSVLARQLLAELSRRLDEPELTRAMERIGEALAAGVIDNLDSRSGDMIAQIAALMRELGYEAEVTAGEAGPEIEAHNCVFHDIAMASPHICEVDLSLLRTLSGQSVDHRRCMARGERSCRFAFKPRQKKVD